jgi:hypothetical protein
MRRYNLFEPLVLALYAQSLYEDVGKHWKGLAFSYLLILEALCWIPSMVQMQVGLSDFVQKDAQAIISQIPKITIKDGEVTTDVATPYFINDPKSAAPIAIIDLTGKYTSLKNTKAKILLTKTQVIAEQSKNETRIYDLSSIKNFHLDRERVRGWVGIFSNWFAIMIYPFIVSFSLCYRMIQALLYGGIGLAFANNLRAPINYQASVRLAVMAVTPVVLLDTLLTMLKVHVPFWWFICFLIAMGYLYFGVRANAHPETPGPVAAGGSSL